MMPTCFSTARPRLDKMTTRKIYLADVLGSGGEALPMDKVICEPVHKTSVDTRPTSENERKFLRDVVRKAFEASDIPRVVSHALKLVGRCSNSSTVPLYSTHRSHLYLFANTNKKGSRRSNRRRLIRAVGQS